MEAQIESFPLPFAFSYPWVLTSPPPLAPHSPWILPSSSALPMSSTCGSLSIFTLSTLCPFISPTSLSFLPGGEVGLCCLQLTPPPQSWGFRVCWKGGHMGLVVLGEEQVPQVPRRAAAEGDGEQWGQWLLQGPRNTLGATGNSFQNTEKSVLFKCAAV